MYVILRNVIIKNAKYCNNFYNILPLYIFFRGDIHIFILVGAPGIY